MARKTKEDAQKTRLRILASALALFVKKGYERTTFTDIASRLKLTKGAVYWHFESKEDLLLELVRLAFERFHRQIAELMPEGELTFPAVTDMMIANALKIVAEPRAAAFFKLMKCQIRWADDSMASAREKLIGADRASPKQTIRTALENDMRAGRARKVDAEEIATVVIAIWDGLVQARLDGFLGCDMEATLRHSYEAIWSSVSRLDSPRVSRDPTPARVSCLASRDLNRKREGVRREMRDVSGDGRQETRAETGDKRRERRRETRDESGDRETERQFFSKE